MISTPFSAATLVVGFGYKDPDGNPTWVNVMLIVGFVVAVIIAIGGYFYFRSKGARDD